MSEFDMRLLLEKKKEEIDRLKEEYIMLQNASDEVEEEKDKEIERLNKRIEDLSIINEEHKILNEMIRKELQQKENIIKEVREYIIICKNSDLVFSNIMYKELLEILDKADKDV